MIIALLLAGVLANGSAPSEPTSAATIATASAAASTSDGATLSTEDEPKVTTLANGMRIAVVRRRSLLEAGQTPKRVALKAGFGSLDRLGRAFRRAYALTPSSYQALHYT